MLFSLIFPVLGTHGRYSICDMSYIQIKKPVTQKMLSYREKIKDKDSKEEIKWNLSYFHILIYLSEEVN